jgi:predicted anti-sigma-YlaC factor YlaD
MVQMMFSCKEASMQVCGLMDRRLTRHQRMMLRIHLAMCRFCRRYYRQMKYLREMVRDARLQEAGMDESVSLPPEACERIKERLRSYDPPS